MREEIRHYATLFWFNQVFSWLPWYEKMIVEPFEDNGFCFKTVKHILKIDCPIMMVHAEDDNVVPFELGKKLHLTAIEKRYETTQGRLTFHAIPVILNAATM